MPRKLSRRYSQRTVATEVLKPSEEPFDLPTSAVAAQRTAILGAPLQEGLSCSPLSTPYNHALAHFQSRLTRTGVMPKTSAVSSTLNPAIAVTAPECAATSLNPKRTEVWVRSPVPEIADTRI